MLIGFPCLSDSRRLSAETVGVLGWWLAVSWASAVGGVAEVFQPINQHLQSGCEPFLAVVQPDVLTQGHQGREPVGVQQAEELVQLGSDGVIS